MKQLRSQNLKQDLFAGVIVALVSIPISMGYAQVAGLPPVYGLYGSLLPILVFGLLTSSPQLVVGVDATPAAMVGGTLAALGVVSGSDEAMAIVPVITLLTAIWLLLFRLVKAGRVVDYISTPVMGGFITGIGSTIILMQAPKLFGGTPGTGELFVLLTNIFSQLGRFHPLSAALGIGTVVIILVSKRLAPKFPMSVVLLGLGAVLTAVFHLEQYGVALLPQVASGLPPLVLPDLTVLEHHASDLIMLSLMVALVIMAQTLLASSGYALRYNDRLDSNQELVAYAAMNLAGAAVGCCPINGSVSRTGIADQFGCRSQLMSLAASGAMLLVLLFGTGLMTYLPVPVLTGIVIAALIGILELKLAGRLWKCNKNEFFIFAMAFLGVLLFGTIYGVVIGVVLSFGEVVIRAVVPPRGYLGLIPGHEGFHNLERYRNAQPIEHTVLYRFSGNLFFANINAFQQDIESALKADTRQVIVDGRGVGSIDITAADRLVILHRNLQARGIRFYLTEHEGAVNDQLRTFGAGSLIDAGAVRRTISLALRDAGVEKPYPLEGGEAAPLPFVESNEQLAELEWLFGEDADQRFTQMAREVAASLSAISDEEALAAAEKRTSWGRVGLFDEDALLDYLEVLLEENQLITHTEEELRAMEAAVERRRRVVEEKLMELNPRAFELLKEHRQALAHRLQERNPEAYAHLLARRGGNAHQEPPRSDNSSDGQENR